MPARSPIYEPSILIFSFKSCLKRFCLLLFNRLQFCQYHNLGFHPVRGYVIVADSVAQLQEEAQDYPPAHWQTTASPSPMATTYNQHSFTEPENSFSCNNS